jgi:hypothetical protein
MAFLNWLRNTHMRVGKAKKTSSQDQYNVLLQGFRQDYLTTLAEGNITPKLTRFIKDYPDIVGEAVSNWYKEASVRT